MYDGLHMSPATREFCTVNAKYQLHILLRGISHPSNENDNPFPIDDPSIETLILTLSQREFSNHVKKVYIESYQLNCNLQNCINNCNA